MLSRTALLATGLLAAGGASAHYAQRALVADYGLARESDEFEHLPTSSILRPLTLGYHELAADYWYLRAIQHFGRTQLHYLARPYPLLAQLLDLSLDLDPWFRQPYLMAGLALTLRNMNFAEANRILRRGVERYPRDFQLASLLGFNLYHFEGRYAEAAEVLAAAARLPEAPDYLAGLATRVAAEGGRPELGIALLDQIIPSTNDERLRDELIDRRAWLELEQDLQLIEAAVARFTAECGRPPADIPQLQAQGYLQRLLPEPFGGRYLLDAQGRPASTSGRERLRTYKGARR